MLETFQVFPIRQWQEGEKTLIHQFSSNPNGHQEVRLLLDGDEQDTVARSLTWSIDRSTDEVNWTPMVQTTFNTGAPARFPRALTTSIDGLTLPVTVRFTVNLVGGRLRYGCTARLGLFGET